MNTDNNNLNEVAVSWTQYDDLGTYHIVTRLSYCHWNGLQVSIAKLGGLESDKAYEEAVIELCSDLDCREYKISNDTEYRQPSHLTIEFL
jgi:hypothetical protein